MAAVRAPAAGAEAERAGAAERVPSRRFLAVAYLVLLLLGGVLGLLGAFLSPAGPRVGGLLVSLGLVLAVVGNVTAGVLGLSVTGSRLGGAAPVLGWLVVVLPLGSATSAGDLVLPGTPRSIAFLLLGVLSGSLVPALGHPTRGLTALATQRGVRHRPQGARSRGDAGGSSTR